MHKRRKISKNFVDEKFDNLEWKFENEAKDRFGHRECEIKNSQNFVDEKFDNLERKFDEKKWNFKQCE